jgi:hypothetical protein
MLALRLSSLLLLGFLYFCPPSLHTQSTCTGEFVMSLKFVVEGLNYTYGFADLNYNGKLDVAGLADSMAGPFQVIYLSVFEGGLAAGLCGRCRVVTCGDPRWFFLASKLSKPFQFIDRNHVHA